MTGDTMLSGDVSGFVGKTEINNEASLTLKKTTLGGATTIDEKARLVFDGDNEIERGGPVGGAGVIEQAGDQPLRLVGEVKAGNLHASGTGVVEVAARADDDLDNVGDVNVNGAELRLNRVWENSDVTVSQGGTLSGNATVRNVTVEANSRLSPGGGIGQINVEGDLTMKKDSVYDADVHPTTQVSDTVTVKGKAEIEDGAILNVRSEGQPVYDSVSNYNVLTAAGGVTGKFDRQGQTKGAFYELKDYYDDNNVFLRAVRTRAFADAAQTSTQAGVANSIEALVAQDAVFIALFNSVDDAAATRALDVLSGDVYANVTGQMLQESFRSVSAVQDRLRRAEGAGVWGNAYGAFSNGQGVDTKKGGLFFGYDADVSKDARLGVLAGYGQSNYRMNSRGASVDSNDFSFGVYGSSVLDDVTLRAGAIYTLSEMDSSRNIALPGLNETVSGDFKARTTNVFVELGHSVEVEAATIEPFAGLNYVNVNTKGFAETDGAAALMVSGANNDALFSNIGVRAEQKFAVDDAMSVKATGSVSWRHALMDDAPSNSAGFVPGNSFTATGASLAKNSLVVEAGVSTSVSDHATLGVAYTGQFGSGNTAHASFWM